MPKWISLTAAFLMSLCSAAGWAQDNSQAPAAPSFSQAREAFARGMNAYNAQDYEVAAPLLIGLCEAGYSQPCGTAGMMVANGQGVEQDLPTALSLFDRGCTGGRSDSCRYAALVYEQAAAPIRDDGKAASYEAKACELNDLAACQLLGYRYVTGVGVEKDRDQAFELSKKACDGGYGPGCTDLGRLYVPFPRNQNTGPPYNLAQAVTYYRKACDLKDGRGCALLADKYEFGNGVEQDREKALELYRLAVSLNPETYVKNSAEGRIRVLSEQGSQSERKQ